MDNPLQKLWAGLAKIQADLDVLWRFMKGSPSFGWAVVTAVNPLRIRYDGETAPVAGSPSGDTAGLQVGDRVWCQRINRRDIVLVASKDTGWVACTRINGAGQQGGQEPRVRRVNGEVQMRWGISNAGLTASSAKDVIQLPPGFAPNEFHYLPVASSSAAAIAMAAVKPSGLVELRTNATIGGYYIFDNCSWLV